MVLVVLVLINVILSIILLFKIFKINNLLHVKQKELLHDIKFFHNNNVLNQQLILDKLILIEKDIKKIPKEITIKNVLNLP